MLVKMGSPSLQEVYEKVAGIFSGSRPLLMKTLEILDDRLRDNRRVIIFLEAPTGYGKSTLSLALYSAIKQGRFDLGQRVIHILPLRSIGTDLKEKTIQRITKLKQFIPNLSEQDVGLQQMYSAGSPMLCKRFVITTLDTFITSFYKIPSSEMSKITKYGTAHYEIPRACIYSSVAIFDEFHLYASSQTLLEGASKSLTATIACIKSLLKSGVPILVMTATLPKTIKATLVEELELAGLDHAIEEVTPSEKEKNFIHRKITASTTDENPLEIIQQAASNKKILVIYNTVTEAVSFYKFLKSNGFSPLLLHSRLIERDKADRLRKLTEQTNGNIYVTTQVLEAGVDVSFDMLVTEAAPPESLIQRAGRVARYGGEGEVIVFPVTERGSKVYGWDLPAKALETVKRNKSIDEKLLTITDEILQTKKDFLTDKIYRNVLDDIDRFPSCSVDFANRVWEVICGFVREGEQIATIPRMFVNDEGRLADRMFCIDEDMLQNLYKSQKIKDALLENGAIKKLDRIDFNRCLSNQFFMKGIAAVIVEEYDVEVGI